ncbi:MAG: TIGR04348 family glycosyltransferase [Gammaproteobacteria bacterium]|uniref:selenoneine biosynthesis selenosugar synthase SenB n=1 Tax=Rhodoferax sp. TaxID=50421 RepID=UPI001836A5C0|nr:selenoneine biosynthesis selenosugar synthase SenB [Rhodoferax sp.]MBU3898448.1 TIGR04348 family glycosyltransferase [Gammaproteobacteria bacterium]MBA3059320.1 TIGR04348 family glycosyltransferase [Rhodoferax sp.]MBU3998562.1 TIGR04348 family glycosyltransferase [Gammaproteobacteria bacterium]MBU4079222.1 TIGR04348 family glycosyltransferase [Gammaproteobacteria bacterium]MBU4114828.1 TIGR04348 family glycosyltransferase [Gammaproteobacteria bacterium]
MKKLNVVIVSPALADANNGNWQTARRWQRLLVKHKAHSVRIVRHWPDGPLAAQDDVMLALHARRSAASLNAWAQARGPQGLAVVLTGTDLYQDLNQDLHNDRNHEDTVVRQSLALAPRLVVLQDQAPHMLPADCRGKAQVILPSVPTRQSLPKTTRHLRAVMVGHLRAEKDPLTLMAAAQALADAPDIFIDHIGAALDPALGQAAQATATQCPGYRWLGALPHEITLRRIQRAHVLVHPSRLEGGAHVVMEAVRCGTPVLASRIDGNVGMLGADYQGYFDVGDALGLAALLRQCRADLIKPLPDNGSLLQRLQRQCAQRAPLFSADREQAALLALVDSLWTPLNASI